MKFEKVTRWRASGIHLAISAAIAAVGLVLLLVVWYPPPLFVAAGGNDLLFLLVGVDVIVGPLITLIIFRPGKKGLKFDLAVIGVVQIAALIYGMSIVYLARPAFVVFVKDRFEVVTAIELSEQHLAEAKHPQFRRLPVLGPEWAYGKFPVDPEERKRLIQLAIGAGKDLQHFPRYFSPYEEGLPDILARAQPVERVRATDPKAAAALDAWLLKSGRPAGSVRYLDLRAPLYWVGVVLDAKTGERLDMFIYEKL
jgi:hypothetical protein